MSHSDFSPESVLDVDVADINVCAILHCPQSLYNSKLNTYRNVINAGVNMVYDIGDI